MMYGSAWTWGSYLRVEEPLYSLPSTLGVCPGAWLRRQFVERLKGSQKMDNVTLEHSQSLKGGLGNKSMAWVDLAPLKPGKTMSSSNCGLGGCGIKACWPASVAKTPHLVTDPVSYEKRTILNNGLWPKGSRKKTSVGINNLGFNSSHDRWDGL